MIMKGCSGRKIEKPKEKEKGMPPSGLKRKQHIFNLVEGKRKLHPLFKRHHLKGTA